MPEVYDGEPTNYSDILARRTKRRIDTVWQRAACGGFIAGATTMFVIYRAMEILYG